MFFAFLAFSLGAFQFTTVRQNQVTVKPPKASLRGALDGSSHWYYVHFTKKTETLKLSSNSLILKDTHLLYLDNQQLDSIKDVCEIKELEPSDKIFIDEKDQKNLVVQVVPGFQIPDKADLYKIVRKIDDDKFVIKVNCDVKKVSQYLTQINEVAFISTYKKDKLFNRYAAGYTMDNSAFDVLYDSINYPYLNRPVYSLGITGSTQVVTIVDSPVDFHHFDFADLQNEVVFNKSMPNHRKIVYYNYHTDMNTFLDKIEYGEHGTHVAGTVLGNTQFLNMTINNGVAQDAKLLFGGHFQKVNAAEVANLMSKYNSKINTNSWGTTGYDINGNSIWSRTAYQNPDKLFLFAAGNEYQEKGNYSVGDPGGSKNVLTVGALDSFDQKAKVVSMQSMETGKSVILSSGYSSLLAKGGKVGYSTNNDFVILDMKELNKVSSTKACETLNGEFISILMGDKSDFSTLNCGPGQSFGIYFASQSQVEDLMSGGTKNLWMTDWTPLEKDPLSSVKNKASYSSTGPAVKGALKPDVVAPGTRILSARSRAHNKENFGSDYGDYLFMDGTSMATPNVAGAAALISDYFKMQKWALGGATIGPVVDLDGSMLRALIIASASHPKGSLEPDNFYGHGIVDLSRILYNGKVGFGVSMSSPTNARIMSEQHLYAKLKVYNGFPGPLDIVLSYLDPQMSTDSPILIANDLDLVVTSPSGERYKGDHKSDGDSQHYSTNEKIIIKSPTEGEYLIHVYAGEFIDPNTEYQNFSIVARGPVANEYLKFYQMPSSSCGCSKCNDYGKCICDKYHVGNLCELGVEKMDVVKKSYSIEPFQVKRIIVNSKDLKFGSLIVTDSAKSSQIWYDNECHLNPAEYGSMAKAGFSKTTVIVDGKEDTEMCFAIYNNDYNKQVFELEVSESTKDNDAMMIGIIVAVIIVVIAVVILVVCCCCCKKICSKEEGESRSSTFKNITERV